MGLTFLTARRIGAETAFRTKANTKIFRCDSSDLTGEVFTPADGIGSVVVVKSATTRAAAGAKQVWVYENAQQVLVASDTANTRAFDKDLSVSAAGANQADATQLAKYYSVVDAATATSADGVKLLTAVANLVMVVVNATTVAVDVFPATSDTIDGGSANAAITMPAGTTRHFVAEDATNWVSKLG
jgi:hypothetical protein